jgi:hypothetical protein
MTRLDGARAVTVPGPVRATVEHPREYGGDVVLTQVEMGERSGGGAAQSASGIVTGKFSNVAAARAESPAGNAHEVAATTTGGIGFERPSTVCGLSRTKLIGVVCTAVIALSVVLGSRCCV